MGRVAGNARARPAVRFLMVLVAVMLVAGGCRDASTPTVAVAPPLPVVIPPVTPDVLAARGQIVSETALSDLDDPQGVIGHAVRAVYRSASGIDGGAREVSGAFLVPRGDAPSGGWPVVSFAHGTTGIGNDCGPSRDNTLMGYLTTATALLAEGYAVAMTDYEGLGTPGQHPYLEPRSAGFDVIDAVRALHNLSAEVSARWMSFGNSQGGQAAWSANELAGWYGTGLELVGSVALSPAANVTPLADLAYTRALTAEQRTIAPLVIAGLSRYDPDLAAHSPLRGFPAGQLDAMFSCAADPADRDRLLPHDRIGVNDEADVARLRDALRRISLPEAPLSAPMLVMNGLNDQTIPPLWVSSAVAGACGLGGRIEHFEVTGAGHGDLGATAYQTVSSWMRDRFASAPAPSNCGAPPSVLP